MNAIQHQSPHLNHLRRTMKVIHQLWFLKCLMTMNMKGGEVQSDLLELLLPEVEEILLEDGELFIRIPKHRLRIWMEEVHPRWVELLKVSFSYFKTCNTNLGTIWLCFKWSIFVCFKSIYFGLQKLWENIVIVLNNPIVQ